MLSPASLHLSIELWESWRCSRRCKSCSMNWFIISLLFLLTRLSFSLIGHLSRPAIERLSMLALASCSSIQWDKFAVSNHECNCYSTDSINNTMVRCGTLQLQGAWNTLIVMGEFTKVANNRFLLFLYRSAPSSQSGVGPPRHLLGSSVFMAWLPNHWIQSNATSIQCIWWTAIAWSNIDQYKHQ